MSYRTHCDWCGKPIGYEEDQAALAVTIYHRRDKKSRLDAQWAEETKPTRHFCASPKEDTDRGGRNRAGLVPEDHSDSCYDRAIAAIRGTKLADPGMGMEWRLMPVEERTAPTAAPASDWSTNYAAACADGGIWNDFGLSRGAKWALVRAGISRIDTLAECSDSDLLAVSDIGPKRLAEIRRAIAWHREKTQVA